MSQDDYQTEILSSGHDQEPGPTADDIGEQIVGSYFAATWGARPLGAAPLELNDCEQPESPPNTIYIGGLVKAADIVKTLIPQPEQAKQLPRAGIPAEVLRRRDEVRVLAVQVLGSPSEAERWLQTPKVVTLGGQRPRELLNTLEGCDKIEQLLKTLYS